MPECAICFRTCSTSESLTSLRNDCDQYGLTEDFKLSYNTCIDTAKLHGDVICYDCKRDIEGSFRLGVKHTGDTSQILQAKFTYYKQMIEKEIIDDPVQQNNLRAARSQSSAKEHQISPQAKRL